MVSDYGALLGFDSPLFEATVTDLIRDRSDLLPVFPAPFSCGNDDALCSNVELTNWIEDANVDSATVLFGYVPDGICHSIEGDTLALALYASDWGQGGKETRVWAYCGVVNTKYLTCLQRNSVVSLDGYSNASSFTVGIERSGSVCYVSPVELFSAPWVSEYDEPRNVEKLADVHIDALPFVGSGVASLTDIGDYHYYYPSALASRLMGVIRTDGARYYDRDGDVVFEDVRCGKPFRQEYQALIANKDIALSAVSKEDKALVWYVTLHRGANILADERHPDHISETEISWLVWHDGDGGFRCCVMSDVYSEVNFETDPSEVIKNLIERYESKKEPDDAV